MTAIWPLLLAVAAALPPDAVQVRLDANGWVSKAETDALWWWSPACAPQKNATSCVAPERLQVRLVDAKGHPAASARIVWGSEAMLRELPDELLPSSTTDADGTATLAVSPKTALRVRAAGPEYATAWRAVAAGERAPIRLTASPAVKCHPRLEAADGKPVVHAREVLLPLQCETLCPDRFMTFDGELIAVAHSAYRLVVWSDSHAPATRVVTDTDAAVTLANGASIAATITDNDRKPLRDASLEVKFRLPSLKEGIRRLAAVAPDGTAAIGGLAAGPLQWAATASGRARRVGDAQLESGANDLGAIRLDRARALVVHVVDAARIAVAGAKVVAHGAAAAVTDAKGAARFAQLPASDVELRVDAAGYLPATLMTRDQAEATIVLDRGSGVRAALLRDDGRVAPFDLDVRVTNNGVQTMHRLHAAPDIVLTGLKPGTARLRIFSADAAPHDTGDLHLGDNNVTDLGTIVLASGHALRGTISDDGGAAVGGARIRTLRVDGDSPSLAHVMGNWIEATSAGDGSFRIGGLTPGAQVIVIDANGFAQTVVPNVAIQGDGAESDAGSIALSRGVEVALSCRPVLQCPAEAMLLPAGGDFPFLAQSAALESGRATFHAVAPGEPLLRLAANHQVRFETSVSIARGRERQTIEIELPSTRVHGDVVIGAERVRGGSLLFTRVMQSSGVPILMNSKTDEGSVVGKDWIGTIPAATPAQVGGGGEFAIEAIEPGSYDVTYAAGDGVTSPARIALTEAANQTLHLRFDDRVLAGSVVDRDGKAAMAAIRVVDGNGASRTATTDPDGRFRLLGLGAGTARIEARSGSRKAQTSIDPGDAAAQQLLLRLGDDRQNGIVLSVFDDDGRPAPGVLAFALSGDGLLAASTDTEGRASFAAIDDALPHLVAAQRPGAAWAFSTARAGETSQAMFPNRPATLVVRAASAAGALRIAAPNGFPLERVLPMLGIVPQLSANGSVTIGGIPAGTYTVGVGVRQQSVSIRSGETAVAKFE